MVADGRDSEVRELRLEGVGLFVIGGVLLMRVTETSS